MKTKMILLLSLLLTSPFAFADEDAELSGNAALPLAEISSAKAGRGCGTHYNFSKEPVGTDGVPICPALNPGTGPNVYMLCAFEQARTFHTPTDAEHTAMLALLNALKANDVKSMLSNASALDLQVCYNTQSKYYVMITKPGVQTYSGPFLVYRKEGASPLVIQNGHDKDCTSIEYGKMLFQNTNAVFSMSNGYSRALSGIKQKTCWGASYESDGTHNSNNLFYLTHRMIAQLWPTTVFIHNHGMKDNGMQITNSLGFDVGPNSLINAFATELLAVVQKRGWTADKIAALKVCSPGTPLPAIRCQLQATWIEGRQMAGSKDPGCANGSQNSNRWLGMEQSASQILNHPEILSEVLRNIESGYLKGAKVN